MKQYDHTKIEKKWREKWEEEGLFQGVAEQGEMLGKKDEKDPSAVLNQTDSRLAQDDKADVKSLSSLSAKDKMYILFAFAYPSGSGLHVGHVESMTALDILARYNRMQGKNVFFPVGWDAFGLPAENYAIKTGVPPAKTTMQAIDTFREQIRSLGISYDWESEIATCHPEYYKWTQWLFLQLYNKGLAYKAPGKVNWCPSCQTVLANEQVVEGLCERCDSEVEQKSLEQWYFKITEYTEELIEGLDEVDWPEATEQQQLNWIGKKQGVNIKFPISNFQSIPNEHLPNELTCFTTRVDTVFGVTFIVISPELAQEWMEAGWEAQPEVKEYVQQAFRKTEEERKVGEKEKTGVQTNLRAVNPVNGEEVPVFVADYVLAEYGTGAVMGVPAHDERDFAFAKKYGLEIKPVITPQITGGKDEKYFQQRSESHKGLLKELVALSEKNDKKFLLMGGWALYSHLQRDYRSFEDLDIVVMEEDVTWWREKLQELGLEIQHMFGGYNDEYYFQAVTEGIHVDVLTIRVDVEGNVVWLTKKEPKVGEKFDSVFEQSAMFSGPVYVMREEVIYKEKLKHAQDRRWKEKADFLFMKKEPFVEYGTLVNSGEFSGMSSEEAMNKIPAAYPEQMKQETMYKLRDWLISRQRYWGAPIPIVYDPEGKAHPVPEEHLPWKLPEDVDFNPTGESPLKSSKEFVERTERIFGEGWRPEYDTMDTFVDSSWYYLRYADARNQDAFAREERLDYWLPVDFYMIGPEHIVLHLLYSRFFTKFLRDEGYLDFNEPFQKMRHQGMILGPDHRKMSKSKGNVINPDSVVEEYGADTLRMYEMFMGPIDADKPWDESSVRGVKRFLERVWNLMTKEGGAETDPELTSKFHQTLKQVSEQIPELKFNTAIAAMMELVNAWSAAVKEGKGLGEEERRSFVKMLAPMAPFVAEELWEVISMSETKRDLDGISRQARNDKDVESVHVEPWPTYDEDKIVADEVTVVVQVNGKTRADVHIPIDEYEGYADTQKAVEERVRAEERVQKWLAEGEVRKVIFIPVREGQGLVNFVVS